MLESEYAKGLNPEYVKELRAKFTFPLYAYDKIQKRYFPIDIEYRPEFNNELFGLDLMEDGNGCFPIYEDGYSTPTYISEDFKRSEYNKRWYESNKDKKLAYQKEYYQKKKLK